MMDRMELLMRRRSADAFQKADPASVQFTRKAAPTKTAAGGYAAASSPDVIPPQTVRIVHNTRRYKPGLVNAEAGDIPQTEYLLLGPHNLNVQVDDEFLWRGENYKVVGIHPWRTETTLCMIEFNGPENRNA